MRSTDTFLRVTTIATVALGFVLTAGPAVAAAPSDRLERKIEVMERVLDEVLLQSEHVVVSSGEVTRGLRLDGYGVLFTFEGSLGEGLGRGARGFIALGDDGTVTTPFRVGGDPSELSRELKEQQAKAAAERDADRAALQAELTDALLDYGATLNQLGPDDRVVVAAFLGGGSPFSVGLPIDGGDDEEQLVLTARFRDLQRFLVGELSRQEAAALITVERR